MRVSACPGTGALAGRAPCGGRRGAPQEPRGHFSWAPVQTKHRRERAPGPRAAAAAAPPPSDQCFLPLVVRHLTRRAWPRCVNQWVSC